MREIGKPSTWTRPPLATGRGWLGADTSFQIFHPVDNLWGHVGEVLVSISIHEENNKAMTTKETTRTKSVLFALSFGFFPIMWWIMGVPPHLWLGPVLHCSHGMIGRPRGGFPGTTRFRHLRKKFSGVGEEPGNNRKWGRGIDGLASNQRWKWVNGGFWILWMAWWIMGVSRPLWLNPNNVVTYGSPPTPWLDLMNDCD